MLKLLSRRKQAPLESYSVFHTDIHSHLIPGIDDGSKSMEQSLDLIRQMKDLGFKKLITTPHVIADAYQNTTSTILSGFEKLNEAVIHAQIDIALGVAAEYYLD